jgi:hypothetical protein
VALLRPIRYYVTRGSLTTPTCALHPRKISPARRSRATLRRELAHRQDIDRSAPRTQRSPDAAHPAGSAKPSGVDECPRWMLAGDQTSPRWILGTLGARPGRPPSRRRNRPRATGTSAPAESSSRDAAALRACVMNRTCVRRIGRPADGTCTNRCLCVQCAAAGLAKWLKQTDCSASRLQRELRGTSAFGPGCARLVARKEAMPRVRAGGIASLRRCPAGRAPRDEALDRGRV